MIGLISISVLARFGNILASCSYDQRVIIWQEGGGQWSKIYEYTNHDSSVNRYAGTPRFGPLERPCTGTK
jgi:WD40 repeat protein